MNIIHMMKNSIDLSEISLNLIQFHLIMQIIVIKHSIFNGSQQIHYCSFMDNFSQINLDSIIGNLQTLISQEIFKRDNQVEKSISAINSSEMIIKIQLEQNQELQKLLMILNKQMNIFNVLMI
ncbi:unnamed protein product [Paramecium primaurelia]|uniref:Uncharacterized protein n=1 Tax=Paramecium primaurelia TaxID=5886 RepID=A0A8S1NB67_PARPR|nr:unnamed protein product [Paramecium primaurelia]